MPCKPATCFLSYRTYSWQGRTWFRRHWTGAGLPAAPDVSGEDAAFVAYPSEDMHGGERGWSCKEVACCQVQCSVPCSGPCSSAPLTDSGDDLHAPCLDFAAQRRLCGKVCCMQCRIWRSAARLTCFMYLEGSSILCLGLWLCLFDLLLWAMDDGLMSEDATCK